MKINAKLISLIPGVFLTASGSAIAQDAADDEADVILTIEAQWEAEQNGEDEWLDNLLVDDFSGWPKNSPAPRGRASTKMWDRLNDELGKTIGHELYFQNIVVHGDVAIAHYLYTNAFQDKDKKIEVNNGRYTDILVRTEDGWKFIAWHGGEDE